MYHVAFSYGMQRIYTSCWRNGEVVDLRLIFLETKLCSQLPKNNLSETWKWVIFYSKIITRKVISGKILKRKRSISGLQTNYFIWFFTITRKCYISADIILLLSCFCAWTLDHHISRFSLDYQHICRMKSNIFFR